MYRQGYGGGGFGSTPWATMNTGNDDLDSFFAEVNARLEGREFDPGSYLINRRAGDQEAYIKKMIEDLRKNREHGEFGLAGGHYGTEEGWNGEDPKEATFGLGIDWGESNPFIYDHNGNIVGMNPNYEWAKGKPGDSWWDSMQGSKFTKAAKALVGKFIPGVGLISELGDAINYLAKNWGHGGSDSQISGTGQGSEDEPPPFWNEGSGSGWVPPAFPDRGSMEDDGNLIPGGGAEEPEPIDTNQGGDDTSGGGVGFPGTPGDGGADPNFQFPTGQYDYGWDQSLAKYGGVANLAGGSGMPGYGGGDYDPYAYYGEPGGGAPVNYEGGGGYEGNVANGYTMDSRLQRLLQNDPAAHYTSNPFVGGSYNGTPGGDQRNIPFGFGGQMVQYNTTPYYEAMSRGIDENAQKAAEAQAEQFGAQGMRWSTPLLSAQGETMRGAADDKSRLLSKLDYDEWQNSYDRASGEQRDIYGRSRDLEQEGYDRFRQGDERDWNRWRYNDETGWDRAQRKGDRAFERTLALDDRSFQRLRDTEQEEFNRWQSGDQTAYGRWMDANQRRTALEKERYNRWLTGDENAFNREQAAANFDLALGGQQDAYNRGLYGDVLNMGGLDERLAQGDLDAYRELWERSQAGYDDQLLPLLSVLLGNSPQSQKEGFDWSKLVEALGNVDWGSMYGDDGGGGSSAGYSGGYID